MFAKLKSLLIDVDGKNDRQPRQYDEHMVAVGALLLHIAAIDGRTSDEEKRLISELIAANFNLDDDQIKNLMGQARDREKKAVDIYNFTNDIKNYLDHEQRLKVVELMWEIAFADGVLDAFEDNVIWRASDLLGISTRDRTILKKRFRGL